MSNLMNRSNSQNLSKDSKEKREGISRREFGKIAAGLGFVSLSGMGGALKAEDRAQATREEYDIKKINGVMQWKIDRSKFERFDSSNYGFNSLSRKLGKNWLWARGANSGRLMNESKYHPDIPAPSVADARAVKSLESASFALRRMTKMVEGEDWLTDKPYIVPRGLKVKPHETDAKKLTVQTKLASRFFGSDIVGCAPLNRDWVYSKYQKNRSAPGEAITKNIVFGDVEHMEETDTDLIIPNSVNNVIVTAFEQNRELIQTSPSAMNAAATNLGYSRMFSHDLMLAEFIRGLGYIAIPTNNVFGLAVPMAVEAGLGEAGRLGTLITPEYGPNVRLSKIFTNMPIVPDQPIEFGVQEFCETCKKCARECPSKTINEGSKSFDARTEGSQDGVYKWQNDYPKCLEYWVETGTSCSNCLAVCPFTKGAIWVHDGVRFVIDKMRWAQPVMLGLDDAFGYGERRKEDDVWNMSIGTYGLDSKHFKNSIEKGKFPL